MAWLHAVPYDKKGKAQSPRINSYKGRLPEPGALAYLIALFEEVGRWQCDGNGYFSLTWQELMAWHTASKRDCEYWELKLLIDMSWTYTASHQKATNTKCDVPQWVIDDIKRGRA